MTHIAISSIFIHQGLYPRSVTEPTVKHGREGLVILTSSRRKVWEHRSSIEQFAKDTVLVLKSLPLCLIQLSGSRFGQLV